MRNKQRALEEEIENIAQGNTTSQSFFVKYFKRKTAMSPKEYKENH